MFLRPRFQPLWGGTQRQAVGAWSDPLSIFLRPPHCFAQRQDWFHPSQPCTRVPTSPNACQYLFPSAVGLFYFNCYYPSSKFFDKHLLIWQSEGVPGGRRAELEAEATSDPLGRSMGVQQR